MFVNKIVNLHICKTFKNKPFCMQQELKLTGSLWFIAMVAQYAADLHSETSSQAEELEGSGPGPAEYPAPQIGNGASIENWQPGAPIAPEPAAATKPKTRRSPAQVKADNDAAAKAKAEGAAPAPNPFPATIMPDPQAATVFPTQAPAVDYSQQPWLTPTAPQQPAPQPQVQAWLEPAPVGPKLDDLYQIMQQGTNDPIKRGKFQQYFAHLGVADLPSIPKERYGEVYATLSQIVAGQI